MIPKAAGLLMQGAWCLGGEASFEDVTCQLALFQNKIVQIQIMNKTELI